MRLGAAAAAVAACAVGLALLMAVPRGPPGDSTEDQAVQPVAAPLDEATRAAAPGRVAAALRYETVGDTAAPNHVGDAAPFRALHSFLEREYASVFKRLKHERVNEHSLLLTLRGSNPALRPVLLVSHMDVVPAPTEGTNWTHPPFSGDIADGYLWGRGALDFKTCLLQQLEALALLLREGFAPQRTLYLAVGHDEELGGTHGAGAIAALLRSRGVELELVLDEGGGVFMDGVRKGMLPIDLVKEPLALVGTSERGWATFEVMVTGTGGHAMLPPVDGTSVASRIARVLAALEATPATTRLGPPMTQFLQALAPAVQLAPLRLLLQNANNRLVNPVLGQLLGQGGREMQQFVRTTCGVVGVRAGGVAENVLPRTGVITLNCRPLPGQDLDFVHDWLRTVLRREAPHVSLRLLPGAVPAAPVSPMGGPHFQLVRTAILETLRPPGGGLVVAPYLVGGGTDSKHYSALAGGRVFRFAPQRVTRASLATIHGVDERVAVDDVLRGISFYWRFMQLAAGDESFEERQQQGAAGGDAGGDAAAAGGAAGA